MSRQEKRQSIGGRIVTAGAKGKRVGLLCSKGCILRCHDYEYSFVRVVCSSSSGLFMIIYQYGSRYIVYTMIIESTIDE